MEKIRRAFCDANKKRSLLWLMLVLPAIFMLSMLIFGYFLSTTMSLVLTLIIVALVAFGRIIIIGDSRIQDKIILKAFCKTEQYDEFISTIDAELNSEDAKTKTISSDKILICRTATWLVLITPNGSLICKRGDVKKIETVFRETNSRDYLNVILYDKQSFLFPYSDLEELLSEWIK